MSPFISRQHKGHEMIQLPSLENESETNVKFASWMQHITAITFNIIACIVLPIWTWAAICNQLKPTKQPGGFVFFLTFLAGSAYRIFFDRKIAGHLVPLYSVRNVSRSKYKLSVIPWFQPLLTLSFISKFEVFWSLTAGVFCWTYSRNNCCVTAEIFPAEWRKPLTRVGLIKTTDTRYPSSEIITICKFLFLLMLTNSQTIQIKSLWPWLVSIPHV